LILIHTKIVEGTVEAEDKERVVQIHVDEARVCSLPTLWGSLLGHNSFVLLDAHRLQ
jgi:hypothetical protein